MTASLLSLMGERLALFHIVGGLLVVGLGVDYGVFFAWSHDDPERRARTLGVVILCALSTVSVFGVMATSGIVVLHAIGITVALGTLVAFTTALVLIWPWSSAGGSPPRLDPERRR
jgi:predicted exporter